MLRQPATALDGIYADEQAKRGERFTPNLRRLPRRQAGRHPSTGGPAISGKDFINGWKGMTAAELFDKISMDMPSNAPGTLKPDSMRT